MSVAAISSARSFDKKREKPKGQRAHEQSREKDQRLIRRLDAYCDRWLAHESARRARDRTGIRMFRNDNKTVGINEDRMRIVSASPVAIAERVAADVLRSMPEPEIEAINDEEEDAARVAEGALRTNWRNTRMREKVDNAYTLSMFTRQVGVYTFWKSEALNGKGDVAHRLIAGHQFIIDDNYSATDDMKFCGFEDEFPRAELITLFPDKVDEIEGAMNESYAPSKVAEDPLKWEGGLTRPGGRVVDRLVTTLPTQTPPYTPVSSIDFAGHSKSADPLSEKVKVRFMWIDDPTPMKKMQPRVDPYTKDHVYELELDEDGAIQFDHDGEDVVDTLTGPQYIPRVKPKMTMIHDEVVVRKYPYRRHVAYIVGDGVKLWDVSWDGPIPLTIIRDRNPAWGCYAEGTALRLGSLAAARNVLLTIVFARLRKSLAGNWLTTPGSGFRRNQLTNEIGNTYLINNIDQLKEFPVSELSPQNFQLLQLLEQEMEMLMGVTPMQRGQAVGRADSPQTYDSIADASGGPILKRAKLIDQWIEDQCKVDLWFMQSFYTQDHVVEVETAEGFSTWTEASSLAIRGEFAIRVEPGATLARNSSRDRQEAEEASQLGIYALPMLAKMGHIRAWRQAMKQRAAIQRMGPAFAWMLGPAAAGPQNASVALRGKAQRSHHKPGGK